LTLFYIIKNLYLPQNTFLAPPIPSIHGWVDATVDLPRRQAGYTAVNRIYSRLVNGLETYQFD